jgi:hypothetical protein
MASTVIDNNGGYNWYCSPIGSAPPSFCAAPGASATNGLGTVTFAVESGSDCLINNASLQPAPSNTPKNVKLPYGMVNFKLTQCKNNEARLRMTFSQSVQGDVLWKWVHQVWTTLPSSIVNNNSAIFSVSDNGPYDTNPQAGVIVDPVGIGNSNNKKSQPELILTVNKKSVRAGRAVLLKTRGGKGTGKVNYSVSTTNGISCKVLRNGDQTLLKTTGAINGKCTVWATKAADQRYNATVSNPISVSVLCPKQ